MGRTSHEGVLSLEGCRLLEARLKDARQKRLWMCGEKWAEESLLAEPCPLPNPRSKALSFHLPAALCGGQVFVEAADGMLGGRVPLGLWDRRG